MAPDTEPTNDAPPSDEPEVSSLGTSDETTWAMAAHLSGLAAPIVGPLIVMAARKDESEFVEMHAKEALNMHITLSVAVVAMFVVIMLTVGIGAVCVFPLLFVAALGYTVLAVKAAIEANNGRPYQYPYILRLID